MTWVTALNITLTRTAFQRVSFPPSQRSTIIMQRFFSASIVLAAIVGFARAFSFTLDPPLPKECSETTFRWEGEQLESPAGPLYSSIQVASPHSTCSYSLCVQHRRSLSPQTDFFFFALARMAPPKYLTTQRSVQEQQRRIQDSHELSEIDGTTVRHV